MTKKKKLTYSILGIIITALVILTICRWDAWFHNPEEEPYSAPKIPSRVLLTFGDEGETTRYVSWVCDTVVDKNARLILEIEGTKRTESIPAIGEVFESRAGKACYYRAEIPASLLFPHITERYCVETNGVRSPWYEFTCANPGKDKFSFLFLGDVQDTINGITNKLLKNAIKRHPEVEFVAFGGDLIERPTDAYYAETFRSIDSVCTAMPVINVTGNHDYLKYLIRKCERRFALTFPYFLKGMEERDDKNHLYCFKYHNTDFFLLDSDRGYFFLTQQKEWLKQKMAESKAQHRIVMVHHPMYSVKRKNNNLIQRWVFDDVIREGNTDLVLQGHEHGYTHCTADEQPLKGNLCTNPPLYTISHCSPKEYHLHPTERFYPVLSDSRYYQIIDVDKTSVTMKAYDAVNNSLVDSVRIVRK